MGLQLPGAGLADSASIVEELREWRAAGYVNPKAVGWGRWALSVPFSEHAALVRRNPALGSRDPIERTKAWKAFIDSPESEPYRVR